MKRSWFTPTLGGRLSIINLLMLLGLVFLERTVQSIPDALFVIGLCTLTFPLAIFWMMPSLGGPSDTDVIVIPIVIVLNAYLWGHGLATIARFFSNSGQLREDE